jgi:hypothetical protein
MLHTYTNDDDMCAYIQESHLCTFFMHTWRYGTLTCMHTWRYGTLTCMHTCIHEDMAHTCIYAYMRTCIHAYIKIWHTCIHAYIVCGVLNRPAIAFQYQPDHILRVYAVRNICTQEILCFKVLMCSNEPALS